jgi:hypothetical protein
MPLCLDEGTTDKSGFATAIFQGRIFSAGLALIAFGQPNSPASIHHEGAVSPGIDHCSIPLNTMNDIATA